jgi:glucuronosyltransferase
MDQSMGFLPPLSFVPHSDLPYVDDMTFQQRIYNTFVTAYDAVFRRLNYIREQNKLAKKHFGKFIEGELPHVLDMEREVSVVLVNSHKSVEKPRPKMPGLVEIGGAHVKTQRFSDDSLAVCFDFTSFDTFSTSSSRNS